MAVPEKFKKLANAVRDEIYGKDVREAIAKSIEETGESSETAIKITEQLIDGSFDAAELTTEIERKLNELEAEYAPELNSLKTEISDARGNESSLNDRFNSVDSQLAHEAGKIADLEKNKADESYVRKLDENKVDKDGSGQVGWANIAQDARENISGGKTAVVEENSVLEVNLVDGAATSRKRTELGEMCIVTTSLSGPLPDFRTSERKIVFDGNLFIYNRDRRYVKSGGFEIDVSDVESSGAIIFFDTSTENFHIENFGDIRNVKESEILFAVISNENGEWKLHMNGNYTVDGAPLNDYPLGDMCFVTTGSNGPLPDFRPAERKIVFDGILSIYYRDHRHTISDPFEVDYSDHVIPALGVVIYFNIKTEQINVYPYDNNVLRNNVTKNEIMFAVVALENGEWKLHMNGNYTVNGNPLYMPYDTRQEDSRPYSFSVEKLVGDFPEFDLEAVGDEGNPFYRPTDDHEKVYNLFNDLMDENPGYITRDQIGLSTNDIPIYCYRFEPERLESRSGEGPKPYPKILMLSSIHGGEHMSTDSLYWVLKRLCDDWQTDKGLEYLRHNINFSVVPLPNPEDYDSSSYIGIDGINLNRDFDYMHDPEREGAGPEPFMRVESQVYRDYLKENTDALILIDCHSRGVESDNDMMWMASSDMRETPILATTIEKMSRQFKQKYTELEDVEGLLGYMSSTTANGTARGYAHHVLGIPSILWEGFRVTDSFENESKEIVDMNAQYLGEAVFNAIKNFQ